MKMQSFCKVNVFIRILKVTVHENTFLLTLEFEKYRWGGYMYKIFHLKICKNCNCNYLNCCKI